MEGFIAWMHENALIPAQPPAASVLTDAYLPGDIPE